MSELLLSPAKNPADLTFCTLEPPSAPAHSPPTENPAVESNPLCRFFLEGRCRFGTRCHNPHPTDACNTHNLEEHRPTNQDLFLHHPPGKKPAMKTAEDVISRLLWDPLVPAEHFTIGYLDRFLGIIEEPFTAFSWDDLASAGPGVLAIPKHRIQYFKYREHVVWDKASRTDEVFGSTGSGRTILQVLEEEETAVEAIRGKAQSHASHGVGGKMPGGRSREPGEEVDHVDSVRDMESGLDEAFGRQEAVKELGETRGNLNNIELATLDRSMVTSEEEGKVVNSGIAGHSVEEAELSRPVVSMKEGNDTIAEEEKNRTFENKEGRHFPGHKQRPTHFVAIQVTSPETQEAVRHLQKALCNVRPDLAAFCVPLATLHVTLCLLHLGTPREIYRAVAALQEIQADSRRLLSPASLLSFQAVETFHSHVLYLRPAPLLELGTLACFLEDAFRRKDLIVIHPPSKDMFHLTVVKIPQRKSRLQLPTDSSWIPIIEDLGTQAIETICLCEAKQGRTDVFYNTILKLDLY